MAGSGRSRWITWQTVACETPSRGASCRIRRPVNVSTHNGSALSTPRIQGKCPLRSLLQHALDTAAQPVLGITIGRVLTDTDSGYGPLS